MTGGTSTQTSDGGALPATGCDQSRIHHNVSAILSRSDPELHRWAGTFWPSKGGNANKFWSHEWSKHGTCVTPLAPDCYAEYRPFGDVVGYFAQVRTVFSRFNVYHALQQAGIVPGSFYGRSAMEDAVMHALRIRPQYRCRNGTLSELYLRFHVLGTTDYLPAEAPGHHTCPGTIYYPPKRTHPLPGPNTPRPASSAPPANASSSPNPARPANGSALQDHMSVAPMAIASWSSWVLVGALTWLLYPN
ncbi:hypothetical protein H4R34_002287 [Dimargaris verticillata]|uniref:ribonuclease T2 n=1 Tax=Dimargaris verticillata TaxID=2761393 RepID=A0A9W8B319_9FUNG|nr:hypothetical protein H4R34_002287 [Dimargaris verticillata]